MGKGLIQTAALGGGLRHWVHAAGGQAQQAARRAEQARAAALKALETREETAASSPMHDKMHRRSAVAELSEQNLTISPSPPCHSALPTCSALVWPVLPTIGRRLTL